VEEEMVERKVEVGWWKALFLVVVLGWSSERVDILGVGMVVLEDDGWMDGWLVGGLFGGLTAG
jgi:hypothetical protein